MSLQNDTEALSAAMSDMQNRSRGLSESLRALAEEGFGQLERAAQQQSRSRAQTRRGGAEDSVAQELARVLKTEIAGALRDVLSPDAARRSGGAEISVIIHNNTPAQVAVRETDGGFDRRTLEITIDQMVAQSLAQGRQTGSVLQNLFGLAPTLIGR